ncbi:hypothetical protein chiPu_0008242 [Chiloscyllium punctatum]|uniref:Uncharacterized protein n=1 Tax=Chiloscyllium punctatum TaxID=137246 RepID=A0A401SHI0_CHIPU|nr:hypothetical protein [Chiloscyllium punctatum]
MKLEVAAAAVCRKGGKKEEEEQPPLLLLSSVGQILFSASDTERAVLLRCNLQLELITGASAELRPASLHWERRPLWNLSTRTLWIVFSSLWNGT